LNLDVLSWIALSAMALAALAVVTDWLLTTGREYDRSRWLSFARGTVTAALLACVLLLGVEVFAGGGAKEVVFDGWLDSAVDAIDGTDDREEWIARHREDGSRGFPPAA